MWEWLAERAEPLAELRRCWRVEAARFDLDGLKEECDAAENDRELWQARLDVAEVAEVAAAKAAVAAWAS